MPFGRGLPRCHQKKQADQAGCQTGPDSLRVRLCWLVSKKTKPNAADATQAPPLSERFMLFRGSPGSDKL